MLNQKERVKVKAKTDVYYYAQISQLIITREIENNKAVLSQGEPRDAGFCTHDTTPIPP